MGPQCAEIATAPAKPGGMCVNPVGTRHASAVARVGYALASRERAESQASEAVWGSRNPTPRIADRTQHARHEHVTGPCWVRGCVGACWSRYGYDPNVSSWGASMLQDQSGLYHIWAAQMRKGGLRNWQSQSECVHATSATPEGPYTFKEVSVPVWCHGPQVARAPDGSLLMVHVGTGSPVQQQLPAEAQRSAVSSIAGSTSSGFMHHASSFDGPWLPATSSPGGCGMPCQAFHPNGKCARRPRAYVSPRVCNVAGDAPQFGAAAGGRGEGGGARGD